VRIAIAQPTYLPWLGYFDLIDQVERFVVLDSVQFEKQSWQQRNRIKTPTGLQLISKMLITHATRKPQTNLEFQADCLKKSSTTRNQNRGAN